MTILEQVEQNFASANKVDFFATSNLEKEPSLILIWFSDNPDNHIESYNLLCENYDHYQLTAVISIVDNKISLQIVDSDTADVISINNLSFDKGHLETFQEATPTEWRFIFAFGFIDKTGIINIYQPNNMTSLLSFAGYKVVTTS